MISRKSARATQRPQSTNFHPGPGSSGRMVKCTRRSNQWAGEIKRSWQMRLPPRLRPLRHPPTRQPQPAGEARRFPPMRLPHRPRQPPLHPKCRGSAWDPATIRLASSSPKQAMRRLLALESRLGRARHRTEGRSDCRPASRGRGKGYWSRSERRGRSSWLCGGTWRASRRRGIRQADRRHWRECDLARRRQDAWFGH